MEDHPPLEDILFDPMSDVYDPMAYELFMGGVVEGNQQMYEDLLDYMEWYYDIDFELEFDWDMYQ